MVLVAVAPSVYLLAFFFQAEDGIRDRDVTGVQTCALPISTPPPTPPMMPPNIPPAMAEELASMRMNVFPSRGVTWISTTPPLVQALQLRLRSEEHTSELQSHHDLVCRLLLEKKKIKENNNT